MVTFLLLLLVFALLSSDRHPSALLAWVVLNVHWFGPDVLLVYGTVLPAVLLYVFGIKWLVERFPRQRRLIITCTFAVPVICIGLWGAYLFRQTQQREAAVLHIHQQRQRELEQYRRDLRARGAEAEKACSQLVELTQEMARRRNEIARD